MISKYSENINKFSFIIKMKVFYYSVIHKDQVEGF